MKLFNILIITIISFLLASCNTNKGQANQETTHNPIHLKIAISKAKGSKGYLQYGKWLHKLDSNIQYFDLYHIPMDSALNILTYCDALIVSGGPDVDPARYNQAYDTVLCETIDYRRDSLEYALIGLALEKRMPILGICRGEQILNVYFGGSLFPDIPTAKPNNVGHRYNNIDSSLHTITLMDTNFLFHISNKKSGIVNSSHHQAVDRLGKNLVVLARTNDSIVESIGWKKPTGKSFLLGVQWHPEWLKRDNPFSENIGNRFIKEALSYKNNNNK